jgi:hypothetical protein
MQLGMLHMSGASSLVMCADPLHGTRHRCRAVNIAPDYGTGTGTPALAETQFEVEQWQFLWWRMRGFVTAGR